MKRFLIVVCLAGAIPASFPWWFHTRPKPVLLDDQPLQPAADNRYRAPAHPAAAWPNWGRTNVVDDRRERQAQPSKSWLADFLARYRSDQHK